jgi:hypothetical protein
VKQIQNEETNADLFSMENMRNFIVAMNPALID